MRVLVVALLLGVLTSSTPRAQKPAPGAETPDWVARQVEDRDTGRDSRSEMTMRLFDRQVAGANGRS